MKAGDLVRLKQPFHPTPACPQEYCFGMVAGLVPVSPQDKTSSNRMEVILYLYDPETITIYTDETGAEEMFSFYRNEVLH